MRDPIERARYLLEMSGIDLGTDGNTLRDNSFLMEQMELREQLEEVQNSADPGSGLDYFVEQMEQRIVQHGEQFSLQWQESPQEARETVQRMQFFNRLHHQAENMIDDLI